MKKMKSNIENFQLIQSSMYEIAKAAHTVKDTFSLYEKIHKIITKLMYAENIYIALYDKDSQELKFEYHIDKTDPDFKVGTSLKKKASLQPNLYPCLIALLIIRLST